MGRRFCLFKVFLVLLIISTIAPAQTMTLRVRKEDSQIGFSILKWGVFKEEGKFSDFDGTIEFDPTNYSATTVEFSVNTSSVDSRNDGRNRALRSEDFFWVTRYPSMHFKSIAVKVEGNRLMVDGDMTIRGITKRVILPVKLAGVNQAGGDLGTLVGFESDFTINRNDFHIGDNYGKIIASEASIHLLIGAGTRVSASR